MAMDTPPRARARRELLAIVARSRPWRALAFADIRSKYRRTAIGPFWVTISTAVTAISIGIVYGQFFGQDVRSYIPYFTIGIVIWTLIASVMAEATTAFAAASSLIKASEMPLVFHVMRMLQRNFISFLHNAVIVLGIWLFLPWPLGPGMLLAFAGFMLLYLFLSGIAVVISLVCVRYRDVPPMVNAATQFLFFATPIIWQAESLRVGKIILLLNPFAYFLAITREPLLGRPAAVETWGIAAGITVVTLVVAAMLYVRYRDRVAYWV